MNTLNIFLRETTFVVGDGDVVFLTGRFVFSGDVENTISVDVEGGYTFH